MLPTMTDDDGFNHLPVLEAYLNERSAEQFHGRITTGTRRGDA